MLHCQGYDPKPVPSWRKCPLILASRRAEFRPLAADEAAEIRALPESVRSSLPGCKLFRPQQIAHYNQIAELGRQAGEPGGQGSLPGQDQAWQVVPQVWLSVRSGDV
jgi:hypothetical protein